MTATSFVAVKTAGKSVKSLSVGNALEDAYWPPIEAWVPWRRSLASILRMIGACPEEGKRVRREQPTIAFLPLRTDERRFMQPDAIPKEEWLPLRTPSDGEGDRVRVKVCGRFRSSMCAEGFPGWPDRPGLGGVVIGWGTDRYGSVYRHVGVGRTLREPDAKGRLSSSSCLRTCR